MDPTFKFESFPSNILNNIRGSDRWLDKTDKCEVFPLGCGSFLQLKPFGECFFSALESHENCFCLCEMNRKEKQTSVYEHESC